VDLLPSSSVAEIRKEKVEKVRLVEKYGGKKKSTQK
jgi:hypothetical protein